MITKRKITSGYAIRTRSQLVQKVKERAKPLIKEFLLKPSLETTTFFSGVILCCC